MLKNNYFLPASARVNVIMNLASSRKLFYGLVPLFASVIKKFKQYYFIFEYLICSTRQFVFQHYYGHNHNIFENIQRIRENRSKKKYVFYCKCKRIEKNKSVKKNTFLFCLGCHHSN